MQRRGFLTSGVALAVLAGLGGVRAGAAGREQVAQDVLGTWIRLALELVRHTPTMTPPVASRALAYLGVGCFEALASGDATLVSLSGQVQGLGALPGRTPGQGHDTAVIMNTVLDGLIHAFFLNTGPSGQRALQTLTARLARQAASGLADDVVAASRGYGAALARAVLDWSANDGGAVIDNLGFPRHWTVSDQPGHWLPTSKIALQQAPLLPDWGRNRTFALASVEGLSMPDPTPYSEDPASRFYAEAKEVHDTVVHLTEEQGFIARFWSDDPMLSYTPPGHWTAILMQVASEKSWSLTEQVEALALMGMVQADAFIGCWAMKYRYDLVRPVTYIQKLIDPAWTPILITPPFPEYPSGHSVQSAAGAAMLTHLFGGDYAFTDESPAPDGVPQRSFASFNAAADEAAISRLYGGIHFRPAIEQGQALGRRIASHAMALKTRA